MDKKISTIYLDDDTKNKARAIAKKEYISFNQLVLKLLREYIAKHEEKEE